MSVTDSVPNFLARCSVLGIAQNVQDALVAAGLDTISKYAFSSAYVPGQTDERPFVDAITAALGRDATVGELAALRRLLHESYSMTAAELKQSVERQEDQGVKRLAQPERADRLAKQQTRLTGLQIRGYLEPSDRLVDVAVSQYEDNRLSYIEPSACTSKEQEVLSKSKEDKRISIVDGSLRIKNPVNKLEADLGTDLLLKYALTRRGLAFDQANLVSFQMHDAWVERLMEVRHTAPPASYSGISHQQLLNADRKLFVKLAESTRSGVQLQATGKPLDKVWEDCCNHPDVAHLLQPLPQPAAPKTDPNLRVHPYGGGKGKGKDGKSKGKGLNSLPAALREHGTAVTSQGHALCFGYSLKNCRLPVKNGRCQKGLHLCCHKGCFKNHPYVDCPKLKEGKSNE